MGKRRRRSRGHGRSRRRLLYLLGGGALLGASASGTGAFTAARPGRLAGIDGAADPEALLGIDGLSLTEEKPTFTNQSNAWMSVTLDSAEDIQFDVGDNGNWEDPPVTFSIAPGAAKVVNVRGGAETATISVSADLQDGLQTVGNVSLLRDVTIPEAGFVKEIVGTFRSAGNSGQYLFDLTNEGPNPVTIVGVGVNATTHPEADVVESGEIFSVDGTQLTDTPIPVDSSDPTADTRVDFDLATAAMDSGQTRTYTFNKFQRDASPPNADMRGQDVKITLYFSDDSDLTINVCIGACDPPVG